MENETAQTCAVSWLPVKFLFGLSTFCSDYPSYYTPVRTYTSESPQNKYPAKYNPAFLSPPLRMWNPHPSCTCTYHSLGYLWCREWSAIAVEVLMLVLMLVKVLVVMLVALIMHKLWCSHARRNSVGVRLKKTIVQLMTKEFGTWGNANVNACHDVPLWGSKLRYLMFSNGLRVTVFDAGWKIGRGWPPETLSIEIKSFCL